MRTNCTGRFLFLLCGGGLHLDKQHAHYGISDILDIVSATRIGPLRRAGGLRDLKRFTVLEVDSQSAAGDDVRDLGGWVCQESR